MSCTSRPTRRSKARNAVRCGASFHGDVDDDPQYEVAGSAFTGPAIANGVAYTGCAAFPQMFTYATVLWAATTSCSPGVIVDGRVFVVADGRLRAYRLPPS